MQSSARHLFLIIGSVLTIFGLLLFFFLQENRRLMIVGGLLFAAGALMISRGIRSPQSNKNRKPDIRKKYKDGKKES